MNEKNTFLDFEYQDEVAKSSVAEVLRSRSEPELRNCQYSFYCRGGWIDFEGLTMKNPVKNPSLATQLTAHNSAPRSCSANRQPSRNGGLHLSRHTDYGFINSAEGWSWSENSQGFPTDEFATDEFPTEASTADSPASCKEPLFDESELSFDRVESCGSAGTGSAHGSTGTSLSKRPLIRSSQGKRQRYAKALTKLLDQMHGDPESFNLDEALRALPPMVANNSGLKAKLKSSLARR